MGPGGGPAPADAGWARGAGIFGIVSVVVLGVGTASIVAVDEADFSIPMGSSLVLYAAIAAPIIAVGAGSARDNPLVRGSPALRVAGWITFGVAVADAIVLLAITADGGDVEAPVTSSVGALGALSLTFLSVDAFNSASQAETVGGAGPAFSLRRARPFFALAPDRDGNAFGQVGLRGEL